MNRIVREPPTYIPKARIAAYCTCDQIALFKLLKWLDRMVKERSAESGAHFHRPGWKNKMYMGVVHSTFRPPRDESSPQDVHHLQQKDAFYFAYVSFCGIGIGVR